MKGMSVSLFMDRAGLSNAFKGNITVLSLILTSTELKLNNRATTKEIVLFHHSDSPQWLIWSQ